jgi:CheY-like chemotaxis protein
MKKILIADNLVRFIIEKGKNIFSRGDIKIFTATSGEEILNLHRNERMNLIIFSLQMQGISGEELCSIIRNDRELRYVSILITCSNNTADIERASKCKANTYITKPIQIEKLIEKVTQLLNIPLRKDYRVLITVTIKGSNKNDFFLCSSRDISSSGMLIETERSLEKGDIISCSFFLPGSEQIITTAEVVRALKKSDSPPQYGLKFLNLNPGYRAAIEEFVNRRVSKTTGSGLHN